MRSVLLAGPSGTDPAGRRAVHDAVRTALPDRDIVDAGGLGAAGLVGAARRSAGVVVAGVSLTPQTPAPDAGADERRAVAAMAVLSGALRRPLAVVGLNTGPLDGTLGRLLSARAARRPDLLLLGDEQSVSHLADAGAPLPMRVAADPAWAVLEVPPATAATGDHVTVVVDGRLDGRHEADLGSALEAVVRAGYRLRLMPWAEGPTGDTFLVRRLCRRLEAASPTGVEVESVPASLREASERLAGSRIVIALRYRALHAAAAAGVPAVAVGVEPRIAALAAQLGAPVLEPGELSQTLPAQVAAAGPSAVAGPERVGAEIARARAGLNLVRLVLDPDDVEAAELNCLPLVPVPWLS